MGFIEGTVSVQVHRLWHSHGRVLYLLSVAVHIPRCWPLDQLSCSYQVLYCLVKLLGLNSNGRSMQSVYFKDPPKSDVLQYLPREYVQLTGASFISKVVEITYDLLTIRSLIVKILN